MSQKLPKKIAQKKSSLVSVHWLQQNINNPDIVILDATMKKKPNGDLILSPEWIIPGAHPFNFDTEICDLNTDLPHMLCSVGEFEQAVQKLSINNDSIIVIYDAMGIFSSPRAWWMFKIMGHENIFVLDGGLPAWQDANLQLRNQYAKANRIGNFKAKFKQQLVITAEQIVNSNDGALQIIDARSRERFFGKEDEPREGLYRGHIPASSCLPFSDMLVEDLFKTKIDLEKIFEDISVPAKRLVFSCGSGVTACILALAATEAGQENWTVYDGSWSEWGNKDFEHFPIATC